MCSAREAISSLAKTLRRWWSTARGLRKSCVATSGLVMPLAVKRAICSSRGASRSRIEGSRLRAVSPFPGADECVSVQTSTTAASENGRAFDDPAVWGRDCSLTRPSAGALSVWIARPTAASVNERASYRRARGADGYLSSGMSLARRALPSGALAWAGGCGDPGVCIVSMRLSAWQARWPGIASIQSDDAGSSVERESRCEPAFRGALSLDNMD